MSSMYLKDLSASKVRVACPLCSLRRRYDRADLEARIPDMPLPLILRMLAKAEGCRRSPTDRADRCLLVYEGLDGGRLFSPSPASFDAIGRFKLAVGDEAATKALESPVSDRLQSAAMRADGTLDAAKVAIWRTQYQDALRALLDLDARLTDAAPASEAMATAAAARA